MSVDRGDSPSGIEMAFRPVTRRHARSHAAAVGVHGVVVSCVCMRSVGVGRGGMRGIGASSVAAGGVGMGRRIGTRGVGAGRICVRGVAMSRIGVGMSCVGVRRVCGFCRRFCGWRFWSGSRWFFLGRNNERQ